MTPLSMAEIIVIPGVRKYFTDIGLAETRRMASVAVDCITLNYWGKHKMAIRGIN